MSSNNKFLIFGCLLFAAILLLNTSKVVDAKKSKIIIGSFGGKKHTTYIPIPIPYPVMMGGHDSHYHHTTYHHDGGYGGGHGY